MAIPQTDGSGRGFSAHPYPKSMGTEKFESIFVGGQWITRCKKTRRQVVIKGKHVTFIPDHKSIQT